jgi:hypothetical protein
MPIDDEDFAGHAKGLSSPSDKWVTVTPHDTNELAFLPRAIAVGSTAGTVIAVDRDGNEATFYCGAGQILAIRPVKIKAASGASPIIALK